MKLNLLIILFASNSLVACGQTTTQKTENKSENLITDSKPIQNNNTMDLNKIANPIVKTAIEALQANDINAWYSHFTSDAKFSDDGRSLDFKSFFDNAFDKKEKFLTIDKVENGGKDIYGNFFAGQWGTFNVFFKFNINANGKIDRLDIGQGK